MAIRNGTPFERIQLQTNIQAVAVRLHTPLKLTAVSVYLSPNDNSASANLSNLLNELPKPILLLGDLNAHHPAWGSRISHSATQAQRRGNEILELAVNHDMVVLNNGSHTWMNPVDGKTQALDVSICSTALADQFIWKIHPDCAGSDHFPIIIDTAGAPDEPRRRSRWLYDQANWQRYEQLTSEKIRPGQIQSVEDFSSKLIAAAEESIPKTSGKPGKKRIIWWNTEVEQAVKVRRKKLRALRRISDNDPKKSDALKLFHEARSACRKIIGDAKQKTWEEFVQSINPTSSSSEVWNRINRLQGKRHSNVITLNLPNETTNNGTVVSNALADEYERKSSDANYSEKFRKKNASLKNTTTKSVRPNLFKRYNADISMEELMWALDRRGGTSTGNDNISYQLLQRLPFICKSALLELFNNVWASGNFPNQWKEGVVIPIPKPDGDHSKPEGYRPITLLSCLGKLFERIINRRLITELEETGRLDERQQAFRAGKGVDTHLAHLEALIRSEDNQHTEIVSLDISKAYDTTWRPAILRTLTSWKITGRMKNILASFLSNRTFRVAANGSISSLRTAENGVPQGSILSVTLFLVAMQPIFSKIPPDVQILLYADDVLLVVKDTNPAQVRRKMREAITAVTKWTDSVGFAIAPSKSKLMHICNIHHRKRGRSIKVNRVPIPRVRKMKILGVLFDVRLNFLQHFAGIKKSCVNRVNILRILGGRLKRSSRSTLQAAGSALIVSKLFYGIGITSVNAEAMERILAPTYNEVIRRSSGAFRTSPVTSIVAEAGCLPFHLMLTQRLSQLAIRLAEKDQMMTNSPTVKRAMGLFQCTTGSQLPATWSLLRLTERKWYENAPRVDNTFRRGIKAGTSSITVVPQFLEHMNNRYQSHNKVFTDGSKVGDETGAGVFTEHSQVSYSLPGACSVFSAEAYALWKAAVSVEEETDTIIITDSASCIDAIQKGQSRHPWIQAIEEAVKTRNITFCWIPGHAGITGNEEADKLANEGRSKAATITTIPAQDVKRYLKNNIWGVWERSWYQSQQHLRRIKANPGKYFDRKCASDQRALTRLRIGHTRLTHSYLLDHNDPPLCCHCGVALTVQHILLDCRGYTDSRRNCNIAGSLAEILSNDEEKEKAVLKFLKETELYDRI